MKTKKTGSVGICIFTGIIVCIITALVIISVFAWLISEAYIPEKSTVYVCTSVLIVSTMAGTMTAVIKANEKVLWISLIVAVLFLISLLSCTAMFFGGTYEGIGTTALCVIGSALCTTLLNVQKGKRKKTVARKRK